MTSCWLLTISKMSWPVVAVLSGSQNRATMSSSVLYCTNTMSWGLSSISTGSSIWKTKFRFFQSMNNLFQSILRKAINASFGAVIIMLDRFKLLSNLISTDSPDHCKGWWLNKFFADMMRLFANDTFVTFSKESIPEFDGTSNLIRFTFASFSFQKISGLSTNFGGTVLRCHFSLFPFKDSFAKTCMHYIYRGWTKPERSLNSVKPSFKKSDLFGKLRCHFQNQRQGLQPATRQKFFLWLVRNGETNWIKK